MSAIKIKKKIKKKSLYIMKKNRLQKKEEKYRFKFEKYNLEKKNTKNIPPPCFHFHF